MTKQAERMAYDAGRALTRVVWPDDATDDQKALGEHHCPFAVGDPQREPWLRGLRDSLRAEDDQDRTVLLRRIDDTLDGGDQVAG